QLSSLVGINRQKLKTGFKSVYGNTIYKALREERLEHASLLLMAGRSVKEAAEEVGYANQGHFASRFKEKYGVLPKDYLKTIRSKLEV
ncbi:MAG: helix-turn-helix transcriptional regulator, partial [Phaeodactylibacter sp.]|nr:helix-turn-helix transcriptional regulator [Phaeodactylibacter sp.]